MYPFLLKLTLIILYIAALPTAHAWGRRTANKSVDPFSRPRVDINWTQVSLDSNFTRKELKKIEKHELVLTKLIVINRHGHRAPNAAYWKMCPKDHGNRKAYDVGPEDISAMGMKEEYDFGVYLRRRYQDFLGPRFNRSLHYLRAVGEPRILQSALAVAQGMFPDGFGPGGYLPSRPQFVPIFSDMDTHEYLLDDVPCFRRAEADSHRWLRDHFAKFMRDPNVEQVMNKLVELCGRNEKTQNPPFAFLKTVADGMTFNHDFGLKVSKGRLTDDWLFRIRNVSLQLLMQRLYNTDEQQTYTVVDLPRSIFALLNHTRIAEGQKVNDFLDIRQEATFYFVHREALYAFAQFFGFQYRVAGLPEGELPVASSLLIEKLMPKENIYSHDEGKVYVRLTLWTPWDGITTIPIVGCHIPELCRLYELRRIYDTRIQRTGTWENLCNFTTRELDHTTDIR